MVEVPVYRFGTGDVSPAEVDPSPFGEEVRWRVLRDAVVMYLANKRQGTHSTKTRAEVAGAQRKPWRQKGTGRARSGTKKSPIWRGGGVAFGPRPRDYSYSMPRRALRTALCSAVLGKLLDGEVAMVADAEFSEPKTREFAKAFLGLGVSGSALVVIPGHDEVLFKSARNLRRTRVRASEDLNAYDVVTHDRVIFVGDAFERLVERVGKVSHGEA